MNHSLQKIQTLTLKNFYFIFPVIFILVSLILILLNNSFIFEQEFITKYGDQQIYYRTALGITKLNPELSIYTIGYPLLMVPLILLTGIQENWESIMTLLIVLQAFILMPISIYFVFRNKRKKYALITLGILLLYFAFFVLRSEDPLIRYNFLGLIPLSEPLTIFCLISSYHIYLKYLKFGNYRKEYLITFVILFVLGILTRNTSAILYMPILADILLDRRVKLLFTISVLAFLLYLPQLIYNYITAGSIFFNGYKWLEKTNVENNREFIKQLYGINSSSLFSIDYLKINLIALFGNYIPLIFLGVLQLVQKKRFTILVLLFSLVNLLFHLIYWWTKAGGLFERFLLPNFFLLLFIYKNKLIF